MSTFIASYNVRNLTESVVTIQNVTLRQRQTVGILFRNDAVDDAEKRGLVEVTQVLTDAEVVENLENYIRSLRTDNNVTPLIIGEEESELSEEDEEPLENE